MALPIFLRPSTKLREIDQTQRLSIITGTMAAVVGEFERGPVGPMYQRGNLEDFKNLYGRLARPDISFAHDTVTQYMRESGNILVNRKVNGARYSGTTVFRDRAHNTLHFDRFEQGTLEGYDTHGFDQFVVLSFSGHLFTASNTFSMNITDGQNLLPIEVPFESSHNDTVNAVVEELQVALDSFAVGGQVRALPNTRIVDGPLTTLVVRVPNTTVLEFLDATISGSTAPTVTLDTQARWLDVFSENPGAWSADEIGLRISEVDGGVRERYRFTMSQALTTGNTVTLGLGDTTVEQAFDTDSDTTLVALAEKLATHPLVSSAEVETVANGNDNDRSILIVAAQPGPNAIAWTTDSAISGGSSRGVVAVTTTMTGVAADNTFTLEVVERSKANRVISRYQVSLNSQLNRLGYQQNIKQVVNVGSRRSDLIRVAQPAYTTTNYSVYGANGDAPLAPTTINWLGGGEDGFRCTSANIRQGWRELEDRRKYPYNLMLNAGYTAVSVQKEIAMIAEQRSDAVGILDAPSDRQNAQVLREYRRTELDIDSSYVAMYTPDVLIEDIDTGEQRYIPPSGPIGATYAYSDRLTNNVGAPAGLNRGKVPTALGLRHYYTEQEQELLYPVGINYIEDRSFVGPVVMAEETLQFAKSIMSSVHARRIMNQIKTALVDGLDYVLYDPNTDSTRFRAIQLGESVLAPKKKDDGSGGVVDYMIKCDSDNNPDDVVEADQLAYQVKLKLVRVVKGVGIDAILSPQGAQFEERIIDSF